MVSLPPWPKAWIKVVLATVGVPPWTTTAPPLTRMAPAASRLVVITLSRVSPISVSTPVAGMKLAVTAIVLILWKVVPTGRRARL
jgi:hypothetical protein